MQSLEKQPYFRLNVYDYIGEFPGWEPITELIKYGDTPTQQTYLTALIKTGGRAGEVLWLDTNNFKANKKTKTLDVMNMKLEKRWKKIKNSDGTYTRQHIEAIRKPFPIPFRETLTKELIETLSITPDGPLFRSPYKHHDPLTVSWGYKFIRKLTDKIPKPLFDALGLNIPLRNKETGEIISDKIHLWQHMFRSWRAKQLRTEYGFREAELMEFFGWLDYKTALHYSGEGLTSLANKMKVIA